MNSCPFPHAATGQQPSMPESHAHVVTTLGSLAMTAVKLQAASRAGSSRDVAIAIRRAIEALDDALAIGILPAELYGGLILLLRQLAWNDVGAVYGCGQAIILTVRDLALPMGVNEDVAAYVLADCGAAAPRTLH